MPKIVALHSTPDEQSETSLFEYNEISVGTRLVYRGKRYYNGCAFVVNAVRSQRFPGSSLKKTDHANKYKDIVSIFPEKSSDGPGRSMSVGYLRQSAHWRKVT